MGRKDGWRVRRTISSVSVWLTVTVIAVTLSWWGVRSVLRDTVFEPPRAPTLVAGDRPPPQVPVSTTRPAPATTRAADPTPDVISQTHRQTTAPPSATAGPTASATRRAPAPTSAPPPPAPPPPAPPPATRRENDRGSDVHSFEVRGGRASFKYRDESATLVAATPNSGWSVKVWPADNWIRVDFTNRGHTSSVFVMWNGHTPIASTYEK